MTITTSASRRSMPRGGPIRWTACASSSSAPAAAASTGSSAWHHTAKCAITRLRRAETGASAGPLRMDVRGGGGSVVHRYRNRHVQPGPPAALIGNRPASAVRRFVLHVRLGTIVLSTVPGSGFWVPGWLPGSGGRSQFLVHGFQFQVRVRDVAVAPIEPATNLKLGTKEPGTVQPPGNLERTRNEEPNLDPEPGTGTLPNQVSTG